MQRYLMPIVDPVKEFIEEEGIQALYSPAITPLQALFSIFTSKNANAQPRYQIELLLDHWELKEILSSRDLQSKLSDRAKHDVQEYLNRHPE